MAIVLIRGGGDLASGVALRLHRSGVSVVITEIDQPLAVRRKAAFAEAVYAGETTVEGVTARKVKNASDMFSILQVLAKGYIPVLVDSEAHAIGLLHPLVVVDGRMIKHKVPLIPERVGLIVGLGPGFTAGENCHAVIETMRGHMLGRAIWNGAAEADTGLPEGVGAYAGERVLRSPGDGVLVARAEIGDRLAHGALIAEVEGVAVTAPFDGVLRGMLYPGLPVSTGMKIGDLDPRGDPAYCTLVSDKALAVGGGVLEAMLSRPEIRRKLWE